MYSTEFISFAFLLEEESSTMAKRWVLHSTLKAARFVVVVLNYPKICGSSMPPRPRPTAR